MTPDFLAELAELKRPYLGNAYGIYSQQQVSKHPEVFFYLQLKASAAEYKDGSFSSPDWEPSSDTFNEKALPVLTKWKDEIIIPAMPDGYEIRIMRVEVSVAEPDNEPVDTKPTELVGSSSE